MQLIRFERTRDLALVRSLIAGDARLYEAAASDSAPERGTFVPHPDPRIWYVMASDERGAIALFTLVPRSAVLWEIHVTRAFGSRSLSASSAIAPWFFEQQPACRRIVAEIPATNRAAIRLARRAGYLEYGRNPRSFAKGGQLVDLVLLGVSA